MIKEKKFGKSLYGLLILFFLAFALCQSFLISNNSKIETKAMPETTEFSDNSFEGNGTATDPYKISDSSDLANLRVRVNQGYTFTGDFFALTNNISIPGTNTWQPIGNEQKTFNGIFDGNGYTISNLNLTSEYSRNGLFGSIRNAKIVNLQLKNIRMTGTINTEVCLGSLVGYAEGDCTLSNIFVTNSQLTPSITGNGYLMVGGLVGYSNAYNLRIRNCELTDNIFVSSLSGRVYSGGFIGGAKWDEPGVIIEVCKSKGYEFIDAVYNDNIIIRKSFYRIGSAFTWYGYNNKNGTGPIYSVHAVFNGLSAFSPDAWALDESVNDIFLKGVGNVCFKMNSDKAVISEYPTSLGVNRKLTITADSDFTLNGATFYQNVYSDAFVYSISDHPTLKTKVGLGYLSKSNNKKTLEFYISEIFGNLSNRQGYFVVDINLVQNLINVPIVERYFDITSNSWVQLNSKNLDISINQSVNQNVFKNAQSSTQTDYSKYNYIYLNKITPNFYEFSKSGSQSILVATSTFVFTAERINLIASGYTLNVNYTNGFEFKTQKSVLDYENYWIASTNSSIYKLNNNVFDAVNLTATSPLIATSASLSFVGWSNTVSSAPLDFYGRVEQLSFVPWKSDFKIQILADRANLTTLNDDYSITGFTISTFSEWDFSKSSASNLLTLHPVWGGDTVRLYTYVYSYFGGIYHLKSTLFIDSNATDIGDFYRLEQNGSCTLTLKNKDGSVLDLSNGGYLNVEWLVAEIKDNNVYDLVGNEGEGFGSLSVDSSLTSATFSGITRQSCVIVVLTPLENIGINLIIDGIEIENNIYFKINGENFVYEASSLVYGEEYVITVQNMPYGYHVAFVKVTNDVSTNLNYNGRDRTCTFIVNFVDEIEITFTFAEGLLKELFVIIISSILIAFLIIIAWLIIGCLIIRRNPDEETEFNKAKK